MVVYDGKGVQRTAFTYACGETVQQIAGDGDVSVEVLLDSGTFSPMTLLKDKDIIKEVKK